MAQAPLATKTAPVAIKTIAKGNALRSVFTLVPVVFVKLQQELCRLKVASLAVFHCSLTK